MAETSHSPDGPAPAGAPRLGRVRAVINLASGGVGRDPGARLEALLAEHDLQGEVAAVAPDAVEDALRRAVDAAPDLLVVVAGDGTARLAGQLCGADGPLLAPLSGGTMNMLPHALYGPRPWAEVLSDLLSRGEARDVSGGEAGGRAFFVAAILGSPAMWAPAREALRHGKLRLAVLRAQRALKHAFSGRLRFELDGRGRRKAEALTLMCPLVSRGEVGDDALEACVLDPRGAADAFRLGARTLLAGDGGGWRADPAVTVEPCREGRAWAHGRIAAVLDGEPHRFDPDLPIRFIPRAFRALAPPGSGGGTAREARRAQSGAALGAAAEGRRAGRVVSGSAGPSPPPGTTSDPTSAKVRLVQLSDVHFGAADLPAAEAAAEFTRTCAPDLVVFTGDVTLNGLPREFEAGKAWLDALPRPLLHTPGNHDTPYWNLLLRALTPFARYRRWIGDPQGGRFDAPGLRVRMINTSRGAQPRPDWSKGAINLELCAAAARELAADAGALRVVGCHHPLVEMLGAPVSGGVHRGETAARVLAEGGVDLILTGHVHVPFTAPIAHPDGRTYAVGAGTLSTRVRGTPPGFNVVEADARTVTVTAQGWTGSGYEPWRVWTLERRPPPS